MKMEGGEMNERLMQPKMAKSGPPPMDPQKTYVNPGLEDQMEIQGYTASRFRWFITWIFILLTAGFLRLVFHWKPAWMLQSTHVSCSLDNAEKVLLLDQYKQYFVAPVNTMTKEGTRVKVVNEPQQLCSPRRHVNIDRLRMAYSQGDESLIRFFKNKKLNYMWNGNKQEFIKLRGFEEGVPCSFFHQQTGQDENTQAKRRVLYGLNLIEVHVTPILVLLFKEVLNPFYIFQVFSCCLWFSDEYYYYAGTIVFLSIASISLTIYQTRKMQRALRNTIQSATLVSVCRPNRVLAMPRPSLAKLHPHLAHIGIDRSLNSYNQFPENYTEFEDIGSEDLVPGDVIEIPRSGCIMQCDAVLISGNCIVNESMLTGESVPVTKTPVPNPDLASRQADVMFNMKDHAKHVLFCGTHVIQTRYYGTEKVKAVVIRTGFSTTKGELVRSIMFPKPVDFHFNRHTYYFIGCLAAVAGVGFVYTIVLMMRRGSEAGLIIKRSLDLITIAVPPALPAAMTVGIVFAQMRLKRALVYCISPRAINVCGSINAVCFDKTGTLTADGLDFKLIIPTSSTTSQFQAPVYKSEIIPENPILFTMATCHSITMIDGRLSGDPLDLIMFESSGWLLEEPGEEQSRFDLMAPTVVLPKYSRNNSNGSLNRDPSLQIGIVRQFTFSSSLQRMSVIARTLGASNFDLYAKGSPEVITSLSKPETVPSSFHSVLKSYTQHGYRVIALAWKPLSSKLNYVKVQRIAREYVEKNLIFLGLLVMENRLKPETTPVIRKLKNANIRTIIVTGDNMLTALSVARECGVVEHDRRVILVSATISASNHAPSLEFVYADDSNKQVEEVVVANKRNVSIRIDDTSQKFYFAVVGKSWHVIRQYFPDLVSKLVVRGAVYARMAPEQKAQLIEALQDVGYYVGMCGDGANDCGALKMAHAGISLSEAEASVASPFTSKIPNIECVPTTIREGRAALVTSFGVFKFMAMYSLIQFFSVCILYWIGSSITDFEFLYIDLFVLTTLSMTFARTGACDKLHHEPPPVSLISLTPILSLFMHTVLQAAAQITAFLLVMQQPCYILRNGCVVFVLWMMLSLLGILLLFSTTIHKMNIKLFVPFKPNEDDEFASFENTAVFLVSSYQYIALSFVFSKGPPYRQVFIKNYAFCINLVIVLAITSWLNFGAYKGLEDLLELWTIPSLPFRFILFGIVCAYFLAALLCEMFIIENEKVRNMWHKIIERCLPLTRSCYHTIEQELSDNKNWPPIDQSSKLDSLLSPTDISTEFKFRGGGDYSDEADGDITSSAKSTPVSRHRFKILPSDSAYDDSGFNSKSVQTSDTATSSNIPVKTDYNSSSRDRLNVNVHGRHCDNNISGISPDRDASYSIYDRKSTDDQILLRQISIEEDASLFPQQSRQPEVQQNTEQPYIVQNTTL